MARTVGGRWRGIMLALAGVAVVLTGGRWAVRRFVALFSPRTTRAVDTGLPMATPQPQPLLQVQAAPRAKGWVRRYRFTLAFLSLLVVALGLYACLRDSRLPLTVIFIERNLPQGKGDSFEYMHEVALEELIQKFNERNRRYRLQMEMQREPLPKEGETNLSLRYGMFKKRADVVAVFDNSWGSDLLRPGAKEPRADLRECPAPIVFLNADHNSVDFGEGRFFVGNSDLVPQEITKLLEKLCRKDVQEKRDFVFVTESAYPLTEKFQEAFLASTQIELQGFSKVVRVAGPKVADRREIARHRAEIVAAFLAEVPAAGKSGGAAPESAEAPNAGASPLAAPSPNAAASAGHTRWRAMQQRSKVIVLNGHARWGDALIPWLDDNFQNLTVIGYQSLLGRRRLGFSFGKGKGNQLILLSDSPQTVRPTLAEFVDDLQKKHGATNPELFSQPDSVFFVRRCMLAMSLCEQALMSRDWRNVPESQRQKLLCLTWDKFRNEILPTQIGNFRFSHEGRELLGQNQFILHLAGTMVSHPDQLSYNADGDAEVVKGVQIGLENIEIRDVNIADGTFRTDFDYWVRDEGGTERARRMVERVVTTTEQEDVKPVVEPVNFKPDSVAGSSNGSSRVGHYFVSTGEFASLRQRQFHVSGTFRSPLVGAHYPFDTHKLRIELRATSADNVMRLSRDLAVGASIQPSIDGWSVVKTSLAVNSRENTIPPDPLTKRRSQHETVVLTCAVRREWWDASLLIVAPLCLMMLASCKVLRLQLSGADAKETATMRTEMSLGCMLAVITYLISYATLAPRLGQPMYADWLVAFTVLLSVSNFVYILAESRPVQRSRWLSKAIHLYGRTNGTLAVAYAAGWVLLGLYYSYLAEPS